jgi:acetylornithine deacetylase
MAAVAESIALIGDLIAFSTVSTESNKELLGFVDAYLARHGVRSEIIWNAEASKGNLWATIGPADRPGVILSGHSDVVPVEDQAWSSNPFIMRQADGRLYGRGACDMKGFLGIVLAFVPELCRRDLKVPVHIAISYDEELGCTGVLSLVDRIAALAVKPALCIVGEPTSMQLVVGHKSGTCHLVTVRGTAAHSSLAPQAVNAIGYAAELISFIHGIDGELKESGDQDPLYEVPHSTLSVTTISGGTAFNIIPERCTFGVDMRALASLDVAAVIRRIECFARERLLPRMHAVAPEASITVSEVVAYAGLDVDVAHPAVAFMKHLLGRNDHSKVAYGTEAGAFSARGRVVSVVCGPGSIAQAHKADEFLAISEIEKCHRFFRRLIDRLAADDLPW